MSRLLRTTATRRVASEFNKTHSVNDTRAVNAGFEIYIFKYQLTHKTRKTC